MYIFLQKPNQTTKKSSFLEPKYNKNKTKNNIKESNNKKGPVFSFKDQFYSFLGYKHSDAGLVLHNNIFIVAF